MFKQTNKVISFLVAASAVISIIPSSVSASAKETKSQEGEIYNAVAYKDGAFYLGGEPSKKDEAAYYLSSGKYNELDDIDSDDKVKVYGTKYVEIENGDYYLDLSNGKVTDDNVKEKELDAVSVNLRGKIKYDNDGRYDDTDAKNIKDVTEIPRAKFSEGWYKTEYKAKSADSNINGGATSFNVYTDNAGKYIDADYNLGKIKVKLSDGKTATIENTNDEDDSVRGQVSDATVIGQDSNNIYRLATITVKTTSGATISEVNGITMSDATTAFVLSSDKKSISFEVVQVISKAQASKSISGIKPAKTVTDYVLSDKSGKKEELLSSDENSFTVAGGKLINYKIDGDELEAATVEFKNKSSIYYIELGGSDTVSLQDGENSVDKDIQGNLWALSEDNLYKFDNDESFDEIYEMDEEYTNLSVYDKDNLVVWNPDDEVYSIVTKKSTSENEAGTDGGTDKTPTTNPNPVKEGWVQDEANGTWSYNNEDGTKFKGWFGSGNGPWYYLDDNGVMATGWKFINNKWYFLDTSSGIMKTGWLNDNGAWYYLSSSGTMLSNVTVDGYKLGPSGAWIK